MNMSIDRATQTRAQASRVRETRPFLLSWMDRESGEELRIEMWGSRDFLHELLALGFEARAQDDRAGPVPTCVVLA